jgi:hypothetical protein
VIHWSGELIFALAWLVLVLDCGSGPDVWLIRRSAAGFASLFYLNMQSRHCSPMACSAGGSTLSVSACWFARRRCIG